MKRLSSFFYLVIAVCVAMIGYQRHGDTLWAIIDFMFWPIAVVKWLIYHEINVSLIKTTFDFLLK